MNKKLMKQFEQQFGGQWLCTCKTPLDPNRFEILSETQTSILVHYSCPVCGKEQMLAAAISNEAASPNQSDLLEQESKRFLKSIALSGDDVLDIREEFRSLKLRNLKLLLKKPTGGSKITSPLLKK